MTFPDDIRRDLNDIATTTPEQQAQAVLDRFMDWATNPRLAVLDTETTGKDTGDQVIEVGIVDAYGHPLMNQRVQPTIPIHPAAQAIHGIRMADLESCPTFDVIWPQLKEILWNYDVVVYNAAFDMAKLCSSLDATLPPGWFQGQDGLSDRLRAWRVLNKRVGCVMDAYAPIHGEWSDWHGSYRWARLTDACQERGVDVSDLTAHHALSDALATLRLIQATASLTPADVPWIGREKGA